MIAIEDKLVAHMRVTLQLAEQQVDALEAQEAELRKRGQHLAADATERKWKSARCSLYEIKRPFDAYCAMARAERFARTYGMTRDRLLESVGNGENVEERVAKLRQSFMDTYSSFKEFMS